MKKEKGQKPVRSSRRRRSESEQDEEQIACKKIKEEVTVPQSINMVKNPAHHNSSLRSYAVHTLIKLQFAACM